MAYYRLNSGTSGDATFEAGPNGAKVLSRSGTPCNIKLQVAAGNKRGGTLTYVIGSSSTFSPWDSGNQFPDADYNATSHGAPVWCIPPFSVITLESHSSGNATLYLQDH